MDGPKGIGSIGALDYTMLLCSDVEQMRTFYRDVMGFELRRHVADRYAEFSVGSSTLALRLRTRPYDGAAPNPESASVQLAFRVPPREIDTVADQLDELGIQLLEPVATFEDFGHRALFLADPENNLVEIYAEV